MSTLIKINNQKEFKEIYDKFYTGLANYAFSVLKDRDAAKDVVQEVFLDLWNKRATLSIQTSLQAYLVRAVKFKSIDFIRKDKTKQQYIASAVTEDRTFQANSDDEDELDERKKRLSYAIAQLPTKCRQAFMLSRVNGYTYKEVAAEMDISVKTVENQISRAFKLLRQNLADLMIFIFFFNFL